MPHNEIIQKRLDRVEYDMDTARGMFQTKRYIYVIFMRHVSKSWENV